MDGIIGETLKIMGVGMGSVFFVLMLFYLMVRFLTKMFPYDEELEEDVAQEDR